MINNIKYKKPISTQVLMVSVFVLSIFMTACEFELPDANSIPDATPPSADFGTTVGDEYFIYKFANFSFSATDYVWNFGDGTTATTKDATHTYAESETDEEGTPYTVTLTASDKLGVSSTVTQVITVLKPEVPPSLVPEIINGDFSGGSTGWDLAGGNSPFNTSSDGDPLNYDGTPSGSTKTPGAKWTGSTTADPKTSATRYAYQAITVTPNAEYILEYSYALEIDNGPSVVVEILNGWFDHEDDAYAASSNPISKAVGDIFLGKGNFTVLKTQFTSNASGQISIWMYANVTSANPTDDVWIDNVKVYPIEE